jgi:hypothetical protein
MIKKAISWLPSGQGPSALGRTLGQQLDRILDEYRRSPSDEASRRGIAVLERFVRHAAPLLAHHRKRLAEEADAGGSDIDTWTGRDIEGDPEMLRVMRQVTAQMLQVLPGIMPPAADEQLPLNLLTLNDGQARALVTPVPKGRGGASQVMQDRRAVLRAMFWMRVGFDGVTRAEMVKHFVDLTELTQRTIESIAGRADDDESQLFKSIGEARRAGLPDGFPLPTPTDDHIRQSAKD